MARFQGILVASAILALILSGGLAALSLLFLAMNLVTAQVLLAGIVEVLISYLFLVAGWGMLFAVIRTMRESEDSLGGRLTFGFSALICGVCWIIIGVNGLRAPEILILLFGT